MILSLLLMKKAKGLKKKNKGEKGNPASAMANKDMMAMVGSFTILRISSMVSMLGIEFTKEELLSLNRKLNKVKLKKN